MTRQWAWWCGGRGGEVPLVSPFFLLPGALCLRACAGDFCIFFFAAVFSRFLVVVGSAKFLFLWVLMHSGNGEFFFGGGYCDFFFCKLFVLEGPDVLDNGELFEIDGNLLDSINGFDFFNGFVFFDFKGAGGLRCVHGTGEHGERGNG